MNTKTVLHCIDTLGRGGAEKLLVSSLREWPGEPTKTKHVVLFFTLPDDLTHDIPRAHNVHHLELDPKKHPLKILVKLRSFLRQYKPDIIHTHSYWAHIYLRLVAPSTTLLVHSYHFADYETLPEARRTTRMLRLDKLTYRRRFRLVGVSNYVQEIIERTHQPKRGFREKTRTAQSVAVVRNFLNDGPLWLEERAKPRPPGETLKVVALGNTKREKNYDLVIEAFASSLRHQAIEFDIFGGGPNLSHYQAVVDALRIPNLHFKGPHASPYSVLPRYHLYVMSSFSECCALAPLEAARAGLPLLLSDIPGLRELGLPTAMYFKNRSVADFSEKMLDVLSGRDAPRFDENDYAALLKRYSKEVYFEQLFKVYAWPSPSFK